MIALTLAEVATLTGGRVHPATAAAVEITAVSTDSRRRSPGALFIALPGASSDGHDHLDGARSAGATAVMVSRDVPSELPRVVVDDTWRAISELAAGVRARVDPRTIAITGSVGKTTVKDLTAAATATTFRTHAATGSFNNELGVPLTLLGLDAGVEVLVAEVGARGTGHIAALAPVVRPSIAVVTAVEAVHLEVFGSIEAIAAGKAELVHALDADGTAVLNVANPWVAAMAGLASSVLRVATDDPAADVSATGVRLDGTGRARCTALTPWGQAELALPVAGRHHVGNALLALGAAGLLGVAPTVAAPAIAAASVSRWRGEVLEVAGVRVLNDAYNASPASVIAALDTLVALERDGVAVAVLGVMAEIGPTAASEHHRVGVHAARVGVDHVVAVGPDAAAIAAGARAGGCPEVDEVADIAAASRLLTDALGAGDALLVKGSRVAGLDVLVDTLVATRGETAR